MFLLYCFALIQSGAVFVLISSQYKDGVLPYKSPAVLPYARAPGTYAAHDNVRLGSESTERKSDAELWKIYQVLLPYGLAMLLPYGLAIALGFCYAIPLRRCTVLPREWLRVRYVVTKAMLLRMRYGVSGTDSGYAATRCPVWCYQDHQKLLKEKRDAKRRGLLGEYYPLYQVRIAVLSLVPGVRNSTTLGPSQYNPLCRVHGAVLRGWY